MKHLKRQPHLVAFYTKVQRSNFSLKCQWKFWNIFFICQLWVKNASVNEKHVCYDNFPPILLIIIASVCRGTDWYIYIWTPTHLISPWYQEDCLSLLTLASVKDMPHTLSSQSPGWHVDRLDVQLCAKKNIKKEKRPFPYVYRRLKEAQRQTGLEKNTFKMAGQIFFL